MNDKIDTVRSMVEMGLFNQTRKTEDELRSFIRMVASTISAVLSEEEVEIVAREIEHSQGIKVGLGAIVDSGDYEPWLDDAKPSIDPFYWERYRKLLQRRGLPKRVVMETNRVTDTILSRLGNPRLESPWDRRGMVVGHVQSGKTANYTGLVCKAADAGYRLIIVIAGIHNNLRSQTQERIDEGLIGFDSGKEWGHEKGGRKYVIGAGNFGPERRPVCLTTRFHDFNKTRADSDSSEIGDYVEPVVLVIKKNHRTLGNLLDWLKDNSARGDQEMIDQPMLLIDDEADNASINTKYGKELVTTINGQIRDLLNMFHRSCYVGYTATPFANIFIDPDQDDEMYDEDLFPRDFIIGLDAPSNYFGPTRVFVDGLPDDGEPTWLKYITDNEDVLPLKHTQDIVLETVPDSLICAVRAFVLARTIRNLRGDEHKHCSMLINASWRTLVQKQIRDRIQETLERIQNSVRINASSGWAALMDPEIAALKDVWDTEFFDEGSDWVAVQGALHEAIASAKAVEVNSSSRDSLDYPKEEHGTKGRTYIAVGGYSLSRGLTLEGLTVTWFLRNTMMYDTLMQMGRWFGYRDGYEKLCRIWMPPEAIDWYAFISNAAEELHDELRTMEKAKATPRMFGLAVRSHPASLLVTARNKMGSGKMITTLVGLSNKFVETSKVSIRSDDLRANVEVAKSFVSKLKSCGFPEEPTSWGTLIRDVPVGFVDEFLAGWRNAEQSVTTDPVPVRSYIRARKDDELRAWDILIPSLSNREPNMTLGRPVVPASRYVDLNDLKHGFMSFSGKRMRVASRGIEKAGVDTEKAAMAEQDYCNERGKIYGERVNYPDSIYRRQRDRGLFILHFVQAKAPTGKENANGVELIPSVPVVAWGISLPVSTRPAERVEYLVNTVRYQELFGEEDEDDEHEAALKAS